MPENCFFSFVFIKMDSNMDKTRASRPHVQTLKMFWLIEYIYGERKNLLIFHQTIALIRLPGEIKLQRHLGIVVALE